MLILNVAIFADGTVYTVVFVAALGANCPKIPEAIV
jgi:hypothetical protein